MCKDNNLVESSRHQTLKHMTYALWSQTLLCLLSPIGVVDQEGVAAHFTPGLFPAQPQTLRASSAVSTQERHSRGNYKTRLTKLLITVWTFTTGFTVSVDLTFLVKCEQNSNCDEYMIMFSVHDNYTKKQICVCCSPVRAQMDVSLV